MSAMHPDDTIVALSSTSGPGARAIVRVSGSHAKRIIESVFGEFTVKKQYFIPGTLRLSGVYSPLPARLYYFPAPHSYTGQDLAELHAISSPPLVERLIADLLAAGARAAGPGEFTQRAFLAGKLDLTRAEAVQAVIEAGNDGDLKTALAQLAGNVVRPLDILRNDLLNLLADVEAALDFVEEDIEFVSNTATLNRLAAALAQLTHLRRQLDSRGVSGQPMRVALAGPPNAGKSSLFNALAGSAQAIVSPVAGTTRDYLAATIDLDGLPVALIDTAGLREAADGIEDHAQNLGREMIAQADLIFWCLPAGQIMDMPHYSVETISVMTKCDLMATSISNNSIACSTVLSDGTVALRRLIAAKAAAFAKSALAPSQSRCRAHIDAAIDSLRRAHEHSLNADPAELLALELRRALEEIGEMVGAVYTNDLLDRIFSRFCIGK